MTHRYSALLIDFQTCETSRTCDDLPSSRIAPQPVQPRSRVSIVYIYYYYCIHLTCSHSDLGLMKFWPQSRAHIRLLLLLSKMPSFPTTSGLAPLELSWLWALIHSFECPLRHTSLSLAECRCSLLGMSTQTNLVSSFRAFYRWWNWRDSVRNEYSRSWQPQSLPKKEDYQSASCQ